MITKLLGVKDTIVGVNCMDSHTSISSFMLEKQLTTNGITGRDGVLSVMNDPVASIVHKKCTSNITITDRSVTG